MEFVTSFGLVCACVFVAWGGFGLIAAWLVPALKNSPLLGSKMFIGGLEPTRTNLTLVSFSGIALGVALSSLVLLYWLLFWASFVVYAALAIWLRRRHSGREA
ncbi:hypothetical protein [Novilysobacter luteus]|uniref:DUF3784 domain-containing protein n=1 Tax=Novilysobacter luteus TaxID=2822368 RepID=A0ABM8UE01_9GAMM|nr:hypothetical protein [Lysobacter luteus]CAG4970743.1 hypothetical protein LYB30171_00797 [Lysobacter luteus]